MKNGETPGGNWYELVGSSYDRTIYGFEIETTPEQDEALIRKLNSSPNKSHFHLVSNNCADFAKDIINFYYPRSLHRSVVADVGMTTPKQLAKMLTKYSGRHPELQFSRLVIAQVPGGMPRSTAVHGVVESFLRSRNTLCPAPWSARFSPGAWPRFMWAPARAASNRRATPWSLSSAVIRARRWSRRIARLISSS